MLVIQVVAPIEGCCRFYTVKPPKFYDTEVFSGTARWFNFLFANVQDR
jgi:hypothetical protein